MIKFILNFLFGKSVYDQEKDYINKNGYPKKSVLFVDSSGRMSQIIGSDTIIKNCELSKKLFK